MAAQSAYPRGWCRRATKSSLARAPTIIATPGRDTVHMRSSERSRTDCRAPLHQAIVARVPRMPCATHVRRHDNVVAEVAAETVRHGRRAAAAARVVRRRRTVAHDEVRVEPDGGVDDDLCLTRARSVNMLPDDRNDAAG